MRVGFRPASFAAGVGMAGQVEPRRGLHPQQPVGSPPSPAPRPPAGSRRQVSRPASGCAVPMSSAALGELLAALVVERRGEPAGVRGQHRRHRSGRVAVRLVGEPRRQLEEREAQAAARMRDGVERDGVEVGSAGDAARSASRVRVGAAPLGEELGRRPRSVSSSGASSFQPSSSCSSGRRKVGSQSIASPICTSMRPSAIGVADGLAARRRPSRRATCPGPMIWNGNASGTYESTSLARHDVRRGAALCNCQPTVGRPRPIPSNVGSKSTHA